jgi:hypothetical protein
MAKSFGEFGSVRIREAEDVKAAEPDRASDAVTIFTQGVESHIRGYREIHLRAGDQVVQVSRRDFISGDCVAKSGPKGITLRGARNSAIHFGAKLAQAPLLGFERARLVGDVVHVAHESVESAERVALRRRQEQESVIKIARCGAGDLAAVRVGSCDGGIRHDVRRERRFQASGRR